MTWMATAVAVMATSTVYTAVESRKAQKQAKEDATEAELQARKAEVFADTEGQGQGDLATIALEVDDDLDDEEIDNQVTRI